MSILRRRIMIFVVVLAIALFSSLLLFSLRAIKPKNKVSVSNNSHTNGDKEFQLFVNNRPFFIKGVCYNPTPIGEGYDYDLFLDERQPWKQDAELMKKIGINAIRVYNINKKNIEQAKQVIDYFYSQYGIMTAIGHWMGFFDYPCPLYGSEEYCKGIEEEMLFIVNELKDQPGVLFWILGNENNYSFGPQNVNPWTNEELEKIKDPLEKRCAKADIYYSFVNNVAKQIKEIDANHPVVMGSGDPVCIEIAADICKEIDILGLVSYKGKSFRPLFRELKEKWGKPIIFIEYGCDSFNAKTGQEDQQIQSDFILSQSREIMDNSKRGPGYKNCLGAFLFEWNDEWWKHNEHSPAGWQRHDTGASWSIGAYYFDNAADFNMNEEWWGVVSISRETDEGVNKRTPKKIYYDLQELWSKK